MKFLFLTLLSFLTLSLFAQNTVPDINIQTLKGQSVNLQDYANNGKITVISFWATWCSPCKFDHAGYTPGDEYEIEDKLKELSEK